MTDRRRKRARPALDFNERRWYRIWRASVLSYMKTWEECDRELWPEGWNDEVYNEICLREQDIHQQWLDDGWNFDEDDQEWKHPLVMSSVSIFAGADVEGMWKRIASDDPINAIPPAHPHLMYSEEKL